jgi:hypothetical protein
MIVIGETPQLPREFGIATGRASPVQIPRPDPQLPRWFYCGVLSSCQSNWVRFIISAVAVIYFSPRLLCRFDLAVRAIRSGGEFALSGRACPFAAYFLSVSKARA